MTCEEDPEGCNHWKATLTSVSIHVPPLLVDTTSESLPMAVKTYLDVCVDWILVSSQKREYCIIIWLEANATESREREAR